MKTSTILVAGVGGLAALYLLSSSKQSGGGIAGISGSLGDLADNTRETFDNLTGTATDFSSIVANIAEAVGELSEIGIGTAGAMGETMQSVAGIGQNIAQTGENITSVPLAFSQVSLSAGNNVAQFLGNLPDYLTKGVLAPTTTSGLFNQPNAGDAVKNLLSGKWW